MLENSVNQLIQTQLQELQAAFLARDKTRAVACLINLQSTLQMPPWPQQTALEERPRRAKWPNLSSYQNTVHAELHKLGLGPRKNPVEALDEKRRQLLEQLRDE